MADKIEKIYVIRAEGSGAVIKDLRTINQLYKDLRKSAAELEAARRNTQDPGEFARLTAELQKVAAAEQELVTINQGRLAAARQEIQTNNQLLGTYDQLASAIQNVNGAGEGGGAAAAIDAVSTAQVQMAESTAAGTAAIQQQTAALAGQANAENQVSAAIAAGHTVEQQAIADTMTQEEAQAALNAEYERTKAEAAEAQAVTNEMAAATQGAAVANVEAADSFVAVSGQVALLKTQLSENKAQMDLLNAQFEAGTVTGQQYQEQMGGLIETERMLQAELKDANQQLSFQIQEERVSIQSINALRLANKQLTAERNALNLETAEGQERLAVLNATINANNELIKKSVDLYTKQKINIGNYPTMAAELKAVKLEMEALYQAGQKDSVMFQQLSARAQALTVSMGEVTAATKAATVSQNAMVQGFQKGFGIIRQVAYILPGLGIAGIIGFITDALVKGGKAFIEWATDAKEAAAAAEKLKKEQEELAKTQTDVSHAQAEAVGTLDVLYAKMQDLTLSQEDRNAAVKEIQKLYPEYFKNFSAEAIMAGQAADQYIRLRDALVAKAAVQVFQDKYNKALGDEIDLTEKLQQKQKELAAIPNQSRFENGPGKTTTFVQGSAASDAKAVEVNTEIRDLQSQINELGRTRLGYLTKIEELSTSNLKLLDKEKTTRTHTNKIVNDELKGTTALAKATAALRDQQVQEDVEANQAIFENDQESLDARLLAYENYYNDKILQAEIARDKEIALNQALIDDIDKQLRDGKKRTAEEIQSLNDQRAAALINIQAARQRLAAGNEKLAADRLKDTKAIITSEVQQLLDEIPAIKDAETKKGNARLDALVASYEKGEITIKEFKKREKQIAQETSLAELEAVKTFLEGQIQAYQAIGQSADQFQKSLDTINQAISKLKGQIKANVDETEFNWKTFWEKMEGEAISAIDTIAKGWVAGRQKQLDKENELAQTNLENEKQIRLSAARTADEKLAIEAEYNQKQEQLQREQFEKNKKLAEAQLAIEFAVASMRAISAAFYKGEGWIGALAAEALVALEYAAKLAVLEASHFGEGGEVPTDGGQFKGRPHATGGTDFYFKGRQFNAEADELAILNKKSSRSGVRYHVSGTTKQIASALNAVGGGVNFAPGAKLGRFEYGGSLGSSLPAPYFVPSGGLDQQALSSFMSTVGEGFAAVNTRFDKLQVVVDPKAVQNANDRQSKYAKMGQL